MLSIRVINGFPPDRVRIRRIDFMLVFSSMLMTLKTKIRYALKVALSFTPWVISMYVLYWLDYGEIWSTETAHRGKIAVAILVAGMGLSFLLHSFLSRPKQQ